MTTIITRLYESAAEAESVTAALAADGFPDDSYEIIAQTGASSAMDAIEGALVPTDTARLYAQALTAKRALVVVRAPEVPFGAARNAAIIADAQTSIDAGVANENYYMKPEPVRDMSRKVFQGHPRILTSIFAIKAFNETKRRMDDMFGMKKIFHRNRPLRDAIMVSHPHVFEVIWPARQLITTRREKTVIKGGRRFLTGGLVS